MSPICGAPWPFKFASCFAGMRIATYGFFAEWVRWQIQTFFPLAAFDGCGGFFASAVPAPAASARHAAKLMSIRFT